MCFYSPALISLDLKHCRLKSKKFSKCYILLKTAVTLLKLTFVRKHYSASLGIGLLVATVLESPKSTEKSNKTLKKESKDLLKEVSSHIVVVCYDNMCCVQIQLKYANVRKKSLRTTSELSTSLK